jgi:hypothetical protein
MLQLRLHPGAYATHHVPNCHIVAGCGNFDFAFAHICGIRNSAGHVFPWRSNAARRHPHLFAAHIRSGFVKQKHFYFRRKLMSAASPIRIGKKRSGRTPKAGFAFGGVAGFNAYNAGVLAALLDQEQHNVQPAVITCTSGGIWWVYQYLKAKEAKAKGEKFTSLRDQMETDTEALKGVSGVMLAFTGLPGVFRPATYEYFSRWWQLPSAAAMNMLPSGPGMPSLSDILQLPAMTELFNRLWPAQGFIPTRSDDQFHDMKRLFTAPDAPPILFNAYDVETGFEVVYCNDKAYELLRIPDKNGDREFRDQHTQERSSKPFHPDVPQTQYKRIASIKDFKQALWLFWYGMDGHNCIDGAYRRQIMLSELTMCDRIYVVKPQPCRMAHCDMPTNYFGIQDLQTEMWLNSSYDTQVAALSNHAARHAYKRAMQAAGAKLPTPVPDEEPATITLVPISRVQPLGYFNYFIEHMSNFDKAYDHALGDFTGAEPLASVEIFSAI